MSGHETSYRSGLKRCSLVRESQTFYISDRRLNSCLFYAQLQKLPQVDQFHLAHLFYMVSDALR